MPLRELEPRADFLRKVGADAVEAALALDDVMELREVEVLEVQLLAAGWVWRRSWDASQRDGAPESNQR